MLSIKSLDCQLHRCRCRPVVRLLTHENMSRKLRQSVYVSGPAVISWDLFEELKAEAVD